MSSTVRLTSLLGFLVLALSACGGSPPDSCDICTTQEAEAQCGPNSGRDDPGGPVPLPTNLWLAVSNFTGPGKTRECVLTYSIDGGPTSGGVELQEPGTTRIITVYVPRDSVVTFTGGCWAPGATEVDRAVVTNSEIMTTANFDMAVTYRISPTDGANAEYRAYRF